MAGARYPVRASGRWGQRARRGVRPDLSAARDLVEDHRVQGSARPDVVQHADTLRVANTVGLPPMLATRPVSSRFGILVGWGEMHLLSREQVCVLVPVGQRLLLLRDLVGARARGC